MTEDFGGNPALSDTWGQKGWRITQIKKGQAKGEKNRRPAKALHKNPSAFLKLPLNFSSFMELSLIYMCVYLYAYVYIERCIGMLAHPVRP